MSLAKQLAKLKEQEREAAARRANPELEARLDQFIADNSRLRDHYLTMSSTDVMRKLMLAKMEHVETADRRQRELEQWVKENPDIIAKVDERVKATVSRIRPRAAVSAVQAQTTKQAPLGPRLGL